MLTTVNSYYTELQTNVLFSDIVFVICQFQVLTYKMCKKHVRAKVHGSLDKVKAGYLSI